MVVSNILRFFKTFLFLVILGAVFQNNVEGNLVESENPPISAELFSEIESIQPGKPFWVAIRLNIQNNWHSYWKNPGEVGMATSIKWNLPEGYSASPIFWPTPQRFDSDSIIGYGYEKEATLLTLITPPKEETSSRSQITASVEWLACSDTTCLPGISNISLDLPIYKEDPLPSNAGATLIEYAKNQLPEKNTPNLSALKKDNLYEISLKLPGLNNKPTEVAFFPESPGLIDDQIQASITETMDDTYVIALKEHQSPEEKPKSIKGVLVLKDKDNHIKSIDLDAPLYVIKDDAFISMGDLASIEKNSVKVDSTDSLERGFLFYLFTAFIGGMILNLMPCVLPVISLKIMSFVKMAGQDRKKILMHGLLFSLGVLISFWFLAGILMTLRAYGHAIGWGFQLQQPFVIAILSIVILIFSLSMFGIFEMGTSIASWAGQTQNKSRGDNLLNSFVSGVLATAMATPCTGPFLGPAVGFAVTQPPFLGILVFTSLGFGMAFPYLILSAFPSLLRFLPKPGNWMVTFREITAFIMLLVVLWLLWIFGAQTDNLSLFLLMLSLLLFSFSCWVYGKWASPMNSKKIRVFGKILASVVFLTAGSFAYDSISNSSNNFQDVSWKRFHPKKVEELQASGKPILVDFTAKWCLICQTNHLAMATDKVESKLNELGVVKMKADWTKYDPVITEELKKFGRNGVPLYLLYSGDPNKPPEILPQVLTPDTILEYLKNLEPSAIADNES